MNTKELYSNEELLEKLINILKNYDEETTCHCLRVSLYTALFLNFLEEKNLTTLLENHPPKEIIYSSAIHDIGKIYVERKIIVDGTISVSHDVEEIKEHPKVGTIFIRPESKTIYEGILFHHERYDGEGYPFKLKAQEISVVGRIINIVDSFDAMTSKRPYMDQAKSPEKSILDIKENLGHQFDPTLGNYFIEMFNEPKYKKILTLEKDSITLTEYLKKVLNWLYSDSKEIDKILN